MTKVNDINEDMGTVGVDSFLLRKSPFPEKKKEKKKRIKKEKPISFRSALNER